MRGGEPTLFTQLSRYLRYVHLDKKDSQHAGRQKVAARSLPKCAVGTHHNSYYASEHVSL